MNIQHSFHYVHMIKTSGNRHKNLQFLDKHSRIEFDKNRDLVQMTVLAAKVQFENKVFKFSLMNANEQMSIGNQVSQGCDNLQ